MNTFYMITGYLTVLIISITILLAIGSVFLNYITGLYNRFRYDSQEKGRHDVGADLIRTSYWFSENKEVYEVLKIIEQDIVESGKLYQVDHVRNKWREAIKNAK